MQLQVGSARRRRGQAQDTAALALVAVAEGADVGVLAPLLDFHSPPPPRSFRAAGLDDTLLTLSLRQLVPVRVQDSRRSQLRGRYCSRHVVPPDRPTSALLLSAQQRLPAVTPF